MKNQGHIRGLPATMPGARRPLLGSVRFTAAVVGLLTTIAGAQTSLLLTDSEGDKVIRFDYPSGTVFDHLVAKGISPLNNATGMTLTPAGDLLVGSFNNHSVQLYDGRTGRFLRTMVQSGAGGLNKTLGLDYGPDGRLYVVSLGSGQVLRFDGTTGAFIDVVADGINGPQDLIFAADGTMFVTSYLDDAVKMYDPADGTFWGDVDTSATGLDGAHSLALDGDGSVYVTGGISDNVIRIDGNTLEATVFVAPGVGGLEQPRGLVFDDIGNLLVAANIVKRVITYDANGYFVETLIAPPNHGAMNAAYELLLRLDCPGDFNDDGEINTIDVIQFLSAWASGCP